MKAANLFDVHFVARPCKRNPNELFLYTRLAVGGKRLELSLKRKVPVDAWDSAASCIKGNKKLALQLNPYLEDIRYRLMDCFRQLHINKKLVTPEAVKNLFLGEEDEGYSLCKLISYHNTNLREALSKGTLKNYYTTEKYIKLFLENRYKTKDIQLTALNFQFITEFEIFLRRTMPLEPVNPLGNNGIMKHMERLKKMIRLAVKMEWISKNPFQQYSLRFQKVDKAFLTESELQSVEDTILPLNKLELARDLFILAVEDIILENSPF